MTRGLGLTETDNHGGGTSAVLVGELVTVTQQDTMPGSGDPEWRMARSRRAWWGDGSMPPSEPASATPLKGTLPLSLSAVMGHSPMTLSLGSRTPTSLPAPSPWSPRFGSDQHIQEPGKNLSSPQPQPLPGRAIHRGHLAVLATGSPRLFACWKEQLSGAPQLWTRLHPGWATPAPGGWHLAVHCPAQGPCWGSGFHLTESKGSFLAHVYLGWINRRTSWRLLSLGSQHLESLTLDGLG